MCNGSLVHQRSECPKLRGQAPAQFVVVKIPATRVPEWKVGRGGFSWMQRALAVEVQCLTGLPTQ